MFGHYVVSDSLLPHELRHTRLPCPSLSPWVCSNSCPLSQWCHSIISSSASLFSSYLQSFLASGSFPMSQLFSSSGQSTGASASASVCPVSIQGWFPLGWTGWISLLPKGLLRVFSNTTVQKLDSICQQIWKTQQWPQDWKRSVFIPIPRKGHAKECSNYCTIALISHSSKVIAQNSPSQASTVREPWPSRCSSWISKRQRNRRLNCQHPFDHRKNKRIPEKHLLLLHRLH